MHNFYFQNQTYEMSSTLREDVLKEINEDPKAKILYQTKGKKAIDQAKKLNLVDEWVDKSSTKDKTNAILIIYSRKLRVNKIIIIKFVIGNRDTGSVIGEKYSYNVGMSILENLIY